MDKALVEVRLGFITTLAWSGDKTQQLSNGTVFDVAM